MCKLSQWASHNNEENCVRDKSLLNTVCLPCLPLSLSPYLPPLPVSLALSLSLSPSLPLSLSPSLSLPLSPSPYHHFTILPSSFPLHFSLTDTNKKPDPHPHISFPTSSISPSSPHWSGLVHGHSCAADWPWTADGSRVLHPQHAPSRSGSGSIPTSLAPISHDGKLSEHRHMHEYCSLPHVS